MAQTSMIGSAGMWFSGRLPDPPELSFRQPRFSNAAEWREEVLPRVLDAIAQPQTSEPVEARVVDRRVVDDLVVEQIAWQLPYGPPTAALFLKSARARGRVPGVLALHDHGACKWFGKQKVTRLDRAQHPIIVEHQQHYYGGRAWANELARRGYGVLVHDLFAFESRRIRYDEVPESIRAAGRSRIVGGAIGSADASEPQSIEEIIEYNRWAAEQESTIAKSLASAGTTWPGVALFEDRVALDYLAGRDDIDSARLGCGGLSGGGLRAVYLAGTDARIRAAFTAGFLTTWTDLLLAKSYTHTWMAYAAALPRLLDFPELLGLRAPLPTSVFVCRDDDLFSFSQVERALHELEAVYAKCEAPDHFEAHVHPGGHRFDAVMQEEAFAFFDHWLGATRP